MSPTYKEARTFSLPYVACRNRLTLEVCFTDPISECRCMGTIRDHFIVRVCKAKENVGTADYMWVTFPYGQQSEY